MSGLSLSRYLHLTHIKLDFRTLLSLTFLVLFFSESVFCEEYLNKFAVEIRGGRSVADSVAAKHGFRNEGEIFEGHYIFSHEHVHRRSANPSHEHHNRLSEEPEVRWVEQQKLLVRKKRDFQAQKSDLHFVDPLYNKMWYFLGKGVNHTDMNVQRAWSMGYTGKRIVISILDDGIERTHEDLKYNYDPGASYDVNSKDNDPMPRYDYSNENRHGTRCAGEVSARANNTKCGVGVAPDSRIGGVRMLDGDVYDGVEAQSLSFNRTHIDIYSASWGPDDDGRVVDGPGPLAKKAFADGILQGRGGKGNIFVWASGNGGSSKDSCNCDGYTNSIFTLSVSSISQLGKKPWYLEECASTLTTTYSSGGYSEKQIITTDLHNRCTETHTGTSASAPLAGGVVALALEANPDMTWRDVQYITLMTSRPIGDGPWVTNGVGRKVSLRYGYGLMDASAMVDLALKWRNVPEQHKCEQASQTENMQVPDDGYSENLDTTGCAGAANEVNYLEHVQAKITLKSKARGDLVIHLVSPMGTRSTILPQRPNDRDNTHGFKDWAFLSVQFWGENPAGRWMLEIEVKAKHNTWSSGRFASAETTNQLVSWSLIMYGTEENPVNLKGETASTPTPSLTPIPTGECHRECANGCTGPANTQCKGCKNLRILTTGACVSACPEGFYKQNFQCKPCDTNCVQCTAVSQSDVMCLRCKPGYLFQEGEDKCVKYCATGYYEDKKLGHCRVCSGLCAECKGQPDTCTSCHEGMILLGDKCTSPKDICPANSYMSSDGKCVSCPNGCLTCFGVNNCTCCSKGSYLKEGGCVNSCGNGYLPFHVNYSEVVFQHCQQCQGASCNVCPGGFTLISGVCVQQKSCPNGNYFDWKSMNCQLCSARCKTCIGPMASDCLSCYPPYGYNSILRSCMRCCFQSEKQTGSDCCSCVKEGKCSEGGPSEEFKKEFFGAAAIIIALLVVCIVCILLFLAVIACIHLRKKTAYSAVKYVKLADKETVDPLAFHDIEKLQQDDL